MRYRREKILNVAGVPTKVLLIRDSRHPWVLSILVGCIIAGAMGFILPPNPQTPVDQFVPSLWRTAYYGILVVAGVITLIGVWLPRPRDRLMVEMIGLWFISIPLLIYPISLAFVIGFTAVGLGGIVASIFGIGSLARIIGIFLELRALSLRRRLL